MSVFVSYSHDSAEGVVELVGRLRADRVSTVVFDQDMLPAGPNKGWLHWSEAQARGADKVLIVCSERYCARYEGTEVPGVGCGAVLEGSAIRQTLYDAGGDNTRYRVVVLSEADNAYVPHSLKTYHRFKVYNDDDYIDLLAWLGAKPAPTTPWVRKIADCTDIFEAFERAVTGKSHQRILLVSGPSGHGKTVVISELLAYARHLGATSALVDFKGCASLDEVFGSLCLDLRFLNRAGNSQETIADLLNVAEPLLLVFDTYEQSSEDAQKWLVSQFLNRLERASKIVVVIGGQTVPDHTKHVWSNLAEPLLLKSIDDPLHWMEYAERRWQYQLPQQVAESLTTVTGGNPAQLSAFVEKLAAKARA